MRETGARTKGADAFRTIGEAAEEVGVAQHVLRFWEGKFPALRPLKRGGSRRYYRPRDIELLHQIKHLLHDQGYTIKGAVKALRQGNAGDVGLDDEAAPPDLTDSAAHMGVAGNRGGDEGPAGTRLEQVRAALQALAAECASVAAGNSPPLRQD